MADDFASQVFGHAGLQPEDNKPAAQQGYVSVYANRGPDIKENAYKDIEDFTRGAGSIWSLANLRARESFLDAARNASNNPYYQQELTQAGAAPLFRPSDAQQIGPLAKSIYDYYKGEYVEPEFKPHTSLIPGAELVKHFQHAPVNTLLDLGLVGPAFKVPGFVGKAAVATKLGGAAATKAIQALPEAIQASDIIPKTLRNLTPVGQASVQAGTAADLLAEAQNRYATRIAQDRRAMEKATQGLTKEQRRLLTVAHEGTDETVRNEMVMTAQRMWELEESLSDAREVLKGYFQAGKIRKGVTQARINDAKRYINQLERRIKLQKQLDAARAEAFKQAATQRRIFRVGAGEAQARAMMPQTLTQLADAGVNMTADEVLNDPRMVRGMRREYGALSREGNQPGYVPIIGKSAFGQTEKKAFTTVLGSGYKTGKTSKLGQLLDELGKRFAKEDITLKDIPVNERPAYLRQLSETRARVRELMGREIKLVRSAINNLDIGESILERTYRARRVEATEELVRKLMAAAPKGKLPGYVEIDLHKLFTGAFPETPTQGGMVKHLPVHGMNETSVWLPKRLADLVTSAFEGEAPGGIVAKLNNIYKAFLFTLDPTFGPRLAAQTGVIQGSMINTPKDVPRMLVASLIAANKRASELLPEELLLSHGGHSDIKLLEAGINWSKVRDMKGRFDYGVHNWQRRTMAIHYLLKRSAKSPLEFKPFIADALNTDAALERLAAGVETPADVKALQGFIKSYAGDYSTLARLKRRGLSYWFPLAPWIAHAWELTKNLPVNHPFKTSLTHTLGQMIVKQFDADEHGRLPLRDREGNLLVGPNGGIMYYQGPHMDLYESGAEIIKDAMLAFDLEGGRKFHLPSAITPGVSIYNAVTQDVDPNTNLPWSRVNPDVAEVYAGGRLRYYNKRTGKLMETAGPSLSAAAVRTIAKKQVDAVQRAIAFPNLPSPFTGPGHPAPRANKVGRPYKASRIETILHAIGQQATEKMPSATRAQSMRAKREQKTLQRQIERREKMTPGS